jgi:hypothetical protein
MVKENTDTVQEQLMKEIGKTTNSMAKASRYGLTILSFRDLILKELKMAREHFNEVMGLFMLGILRITKLMDLASTFGKMVNLIRDTGRKIKWMEKERLIGLMAGNLMEIMPTTKKKVLEFFLGLMEPNA